MKCASLVRHTLKNVLEAGPRVVGPTGDIDLSIRTHEGIVQLSGFVDSAESVQLAGKVAASVQGVSTVRNDLIVK